MFANTSGQLRHSIKIEQRSTSVDAAGQQSIVWADLATTWAKIDPTGGGEQAGTGESRALISHVVTIRHLAAFDDSRQATKCRINFKGRTLDIVNCKNLEERGRWDVLDCVEGLKYVG